MVKLLNQFFNAFDDLPDLGKLIVIGGAIILAFTLGDIVSTIFSGGK